MLAFVDGIPGGFDSINKVHFIGHSMGAQTVRYLQYLLSIDYFEQNQYFDRICTQIRPTSGGEPNYDYQLPVISLKDKSDYIASLTCINGVLNGGTTCINFDMSPDTLKLE